MTAKQQNETFQSNKNAVYFKWGGSERGIYNCQNLTVHLKCVHAIICKLYLNNTDEKKKAKQKQKDGTMELYNSIKHCQITTYFPSYSKVMYCISILG